MEAETGVGECRICLGPASEEDGPLLQPCLCRGTQQFVHSVCIERWIAASDMRKCGVCGHEMKVVDVLVEGAPSIVWHPRHLAHALSALPDGSLAAARGMVELFLGAAALIMGAPAVSGAALHYAAGVDAAASTGVGVADFRVLGRC